MIKNCLIIFIISVFLLSKTIYTKTNVIYAYVVKVYDGDTIKVETVSGKIYKVRFLGIDSPEKSLLRYKYREYLGVYCYRYVNKALSGNRVKLVFDRHIKRGRYGRLLCYVYIKNMDLCKLLLLKGLAKVYRKSLCSRYYEFLKYEKRAKNNRKGIWNFRKKRKYYINYFKRTNNAYLLIWFWKNDKESIYEFLDNY